MSDWLSPTKYNLDLKRLEDRIKELEKKDRDLEKRVKDLEKVHERKF